MVLIHTSPIESAILFISTQNMEDITKILVSVALIREQLRAQPDTDNYKEHSGL